MIKRAYFMPKTREKTKHVIANCIPGILINRKTGKQEGYLHSIEKSGPSFHTLHIDHLGPLESTHKSYKHNLVIIDSFTKFEWLFPHKIDNVARSDREIKCIKERVRKYPKHYFGSRNCIFLRRIWAILFSRKCTTYFNNNRSASRERTSGTGK